MFDGHSCSEMRRHGKAFAIGVMATTIFAALAFGLFPGSWLPTAFMWPGVVILPVVGRLLPDAFIYWIDPEGGLPAMFSIVLAGAAVFWVVFSGVAWRAFVSQESPGAHKVGKEAK